MAAFVLNIKQVLADGVPGDFAELGVWRGNTAAVLAHYAASAGRQTLLFDTFEGFDEKDITGIDHQKGRGFQNTSLELTASVIGERAGVQFVKGYFPDTVTDEFRARRFAVVSLDCDLYAPMKSGLEFSIPGWNRAPSFCCTITPADFGRARSELSTSSVPQPENI